MFSVVVIGAVRDQVERLRKRLPQSVSVRSVSLRRALRFQATAADLTICTRFLGHKHSMHVREAIGSPFVFSRGEIGAWCAAILDAQRSKSKYQRAG